MGRAARDGHDFTYAAEAHYNTLLDIRHQSPEGFLGL